jgi:hypothetical protein
VAPGSRLKDLHGDVGRYPFPRLPAAEQRIWLTKLHERVRRQALRRIRRIPIHELIAADGRSIRKRLGEQLLEQGAKLEATLAFRHLCLRRKVECHRLVLLARLLASRHRHTVRSAFTLTTRSVQSPVVWLEAVHWKNLILEYFP